LPFEIGSANIIFFLNFQEFFFILDTSCMEHTSIAAHRKQGKNDTKKHEKHRDNVSKTGSESSACAASHAGQHRSDGCSTENSDGIDPFSW